ncbi:hypothetical protein GCM10023231_09180 [Olivibacter ginsenosidimutans]|uniref:SCO family protein n=1 Tax=Olivibacter ginsenosidimutans TaxID=1176537 RepID=A0ABP9AP77_9SPHI
MRDQQKAFSFKKVLILVTILALPGFCYYLLQEKGKNRYKPLPFYGEKKLAGTFHSRRGKQIPDTIYHTVKSFAMQSSAGTQVTFGPDSGVALVNLFYTGNRQLADPMNMAMRKVAERFQKNGMVKLYSLTVDPRTDTPDRLKAYHKQWGDFKQWYFLSARDPEEVMGLARESFLLDVVYDPQRKPPFTHSSSIVLLDSQRRIRGYYNALIDEEVNRLIDEVKLLLTEEYRNISVAESYE